MIGIYTPFKVDNYGTKLQAYAVQEYLRSYDDFEFIVYNATFFEKVISKIGSTLLRSYSDKKFTPNQSMLDQKDLDARKEALRSFHSRYVHVRKANSLKELKQISKRYRAVICGSDQIWNPRNLAGRTMMLEFVPDPVKRISFSPSFGIGYMPEFLRNAYTRRLSRFQHLSIREKNGLDMLHSLGFDQARQLLDPTLVLEEQKWLQLAQEGKYRYSEPYIFCYFLGVLPLGREIANRLRELTGYKVINLPHFKTYVPSDDGFADVDLYDVAPQDFVGLVRNAAYVCTDSFHCTAFSIIFERPFFCVNRHSETEKSKTNSRLDSLLDTLGIGERKLAKLDEVDPRYERFIDYPVVKEKLNAKRDETRRFFDEALKFDECCE